MVFAELNDDQWLESLPLDLDVYFEGMTRQRMLPVDDLPQQAHSNVIPFVQERDIHKYAEAMFNAIVAQRAK